MSQAQKVLKEAGKLNIIDSSGVDKKVQTVGASKTLTAGDSGKVWIMGNAASGLTLTLPAVASAGAGWHGKFIVGTAPVASHYVISEATASDTDVIHGVATTAAVADTAQDSTSGTGVTHANCLANVSVISDVIDLYCDGTNYFAYGISAANNAIVFA